MARGKLRIRQRGSRQQWAEARSLKEFGAEDEAPSADEGVAGPEAPRPLSGADVVASTRCGLCGLVAEQRLRDSSRVVVLPHTLCISCDEVRCEACWGAEDDPCADADEHEFLEVHYAEAGTPRVADFGAW